MKFINKVLQRWSNYKNSRILPSIRSRDESSSRTRTYILELSGRVLELQNEVNCMNDSKDFLDAESVRSGNSHVTIRPVSFPPHPIPEGMLKHSFVSPRRTDGPPRQGSWPIRSILQCPCGTGLPFWIPLRATSAWRKEMWKVFPMTGDAGEEVPLPPHGRLVLVGQTICGHWPPFVAKPSLANTIF